MIETDQQHFAVIMAVYGKDSSKDFRRAFDSILDQTVSRDYVHVYLGIDGPIPVELQRAVDHYRPYCHEIVSNHVNLGLAATLNRLISALETEEFVFRMDADDVSLPKRFELQVAYMQRHPEVDVLGTAIDEVDENLRVTGRRVFPTSDEEVRRCIAKASPVAHGTVCFRMRFLRNVGGYPTNVPYNEDIALWFRALQMGAKIRNLNQVLYQLQVSGGFFHRRTLEKAFGEFRVYLAGLWYCYGITWRYIFPVMRLMTRLLPASVVRRLYRGTLRATLLNTDR